MTTSSNVIHVPDPEPGSYNTDRTAGKLLQSQSLHMREALIQHLGELVDVLAIDPRSLKTEGEVGVYIQKATAILHTHAAPPRRK
jgi:hypothetical protein